MKKIEEKIEGLVKKGILKKNVILAPYTSFRIGGPAQYFSLAKSRKELVSICRFCILNKVPYTLLGGGSNVLISDKEIKGIVIINKYEKVKIIEENENNSLVLVSSGYPMSKFVKEITSIGLGGLEYHLGLPGSVGGAVYMNSKWAANPPIKYVNDVLFKAFVIDEFGKEKEVFKIRKKNIVIDCIFSLKKEDPKILEKRSREAILYRTRTQPYGVATAGCFFKNGKSYYAGKLIDEAGLKGYICGGARVSPIHANFIENWNDASFEDVCSLVRHIKNVIKKRFGISLKEEVKVIK